MKIVFVQAVSTRGFLNIKWLVTKLATSHPIQPVFNTNNKANDWYWYYKCALVYKIINTNKRYLRPFRTLAIFNIDLLVSTHLLKDRLD